MSTSVSRLRVLCDGPRADASARLDLEPPRVQSVGAWGFWTAQKLRLG